MGVAESVRVAAAAAGVFVTLAVVLITVAVVNSCAAPTADEDPGASDLLSHLSLLYKGTYVIYGNGRRSERDLPVCAYPGEACNLAHKRFWLTPITERLCRCPDRSECPLHFNGLNDTHSQHVSNRAQLKFCGNVMEELSDCKAGDLALKVRQVERHDQPFPSTVSSVNHGADVHSELQCRCPWPHRWTLAETRIPSPSETVFMYTCDELPKCRVGDECGRIRADTLESYYSCSCPENHLCLFRDPQSTHSTRQLHFQGKAYKATCTPN
ncbi:U-scoloptoxin(11)-Sm5a-like [Penaeus monodon]|uniref:U-scoloptoxin(11)-Sm5a-like n=1 Tax=Penaeus monodon TaxID=6687 RepID=UPI0018A7559D|nr:U-scoloptoxin(11)-Sm5a-like [Penaeus monodon]XP_037783955.1 U-scoloptoxin(11)-Sm5a-like [Penaeus monodon]XP_037783956.1 U-scoloptoxin(11)-Sm5a-like [Penaeus monodon]